MGEGSVFTRCRFRNFFLVSLEIEILYGVKTDGVDGGMS